MKIIILSGFLGAGKTTFLLRMVDYLYNQPLYSGSGDESEPARIAIIENEIGSVNLDSRMLDGKGLTMREMLSGCICCSLRQNLAMEITQLTETISPDLIIIEATGLASGREIIEGLKYYVEEDDTPLFSIVLVDASRLPYLLERTPAMVGRQLEEVDVLVLNKIDLVSPEAKVEACQLLKEISPGVQIVETAAENGIAVEAWQQIFAGLNEPKD